MRPDTLRHKFTDTHCHLDFSAFEPDREAVLSQAYERGVHRLVIPGVQASQWSALSTFQHQQVALAWAAGLHPWFTAGHQDLHLTELAQTLREQTPCAVGEIGLHQTPHTTHEMPKQISLLEAQLDLARQFDLPVILHQVGAHNELIKALKRAAPVAGGVVHAFSGSAEMATEYGRFGLSVGLGGVITYPRAAKTRRAVSRLPLDSLVLETDGPDMPLCGFQGVRNVPAQIPSVFRSLCRLRTEPPAVLAEALEANATRLFFRQA